MYHHVLMFNVVFHMHRSLSAFCRPRRFSLGLARRRPRRRAAEKTATSRKLYSFGVLWSSLLCVLNGSKWMGQKHLGISWIPFRFWGEPTGCSCLQPHGLHAPLFQQHSRSPSEHVCDDVEGDEDQEDEMESFRRQGCHPHDHARDM